MSDLKERHFLLSFMVPLDDENHIKQYHYVIPENATLPDIRMIRHHIEKSLRPSPRTIDILAVSEISAEDAKTFFAETDYIFTF